MAFLASRSLGICKNDGLLARVGELCGIIRASYLSPFFPLVLSFALWQYLRPQLQTSDAQCYRGTTDLACVCCGAPLSV